jgi:predicted permease
MQLRHAFRYALRLLARDRALTFAVAISLALAIGVNTAIFSVLYAVFLRPFPGITEPERLVSVVGVDRNDSHYLPNSYHNYRDYRDENRVFTGVTTFQAVDVALAGAGGPESLWAQMVEYNYFDVLGVHPMLGRTFLPEDRGGSGGHDVVVLSHRLWRRRFGSDPQVVGKVILLDNHPFRVVGVGPPGFTGTGRRTFFQLWVPTSAAPEISPYWVSMMNDRSWRFFRIVGRRKPGVSIEQASAEMRTIAGRLSLTYPEIRDQTVALVPFMHEALGPNERWLFVRASLLLGIVAGMLLLGACANAANLLLARATRRQRELAMRLSLGATRAHIFTQVLIESTLLALFCGVLGFGLAAASRRLIVALKNPFFSPEVLDLSLDGKIVLFAGATSMLTGLIFGLLPAIRAAGAEPLTILKEESAATTGGRGRSALARTVLTAQVAISFVSLVATAWFLTSLHRAHTRDPGFDSAHLTMVSFNLASAGYSESAGTVFARLLADRVRSVPDVGAVSIAGNRLLVGVVMAVSVYREDAPLDKNSPVIAIDSVSLGHFATLGAPIVSGRDFTANDTARSRPVAIINRAMARRYWLGQDAVGRRLRFDETAPFLTIVGVVADAATVSLTQTPTPYIYLPLSQRYTPSMTLYVRTRHDPRAVIGAIRAQAQALNPQLAVKVTTAQQVIEDSLWAPRMAASLLLAFGILAVVLAAFGIHSLASYSVRRRQAEIGLRLALGASRFDVLQLVLREGMIAVAAGITVGLVVALGVAGVAADLLFDVAPGDPVLLGGTALFLAGVALLALLLPALQASRSSPLVSLRA